MINKEAETIDNLIRKTRREQGLTQAELARRVGITRPYLSDIENSKRQVRGELMILIAKTLRVQVEDIFLLPMYNMMDKLEVSNGGGHPESRKPDCGITFVICPDTSTFIQAA